MKKHIMKLVAVVMTAVMVLSLVPVAALPEVNWPELLSVFGASSSAIVEKEEAGVAAPENGEAASESGDATAAPENGTDAPAAEQSTDGLTPASTDGYFLDESGNIYADNDGDGTAELVKADVVEGDNDVDIADMIGAVEQGKVTDDKDYNIDNTADISSVDTYLQWSQTYSSLNATKVGNYAAGSDGKLIHAADASTSPYEPWETEDEDHPFLPNNQAWIDLSEIYYGAPASPTYPFTKWSSNTPFLASSIEYDANGNKIGTVFPDVDLIHEGIWSTRNYQSSFDATNGIAYNRYDPQQDKWGITLDRNIDNEYIEFNANKTFNLAETPYLEYSTEQVDGQQMAICLQIGTPKSGGGYDYRWYTVTDSLPRPGIKGDDRATTTMEPALMISAVGASNPVLTAQSVKVVMGEQYKTTTKTVTNTGYVDGAVSACIDMVQWLPLVEGAQQEYHVNRVRIYTKSASDKKFAARVNFLYFINQAANFLLPMSDTGTINVSNKGAALAADYRNSAVKDAADGAKSYNNGWINAGAITKMDMTVNHTYNMELDSTVSGLDSFSKDSKEYVMVQIPIRKWANTSWDARRLQISIDVDDDGASHRPAFLFLGNNTGITSGAASVGDRGYDSDKDSILGVYGGVNSSGSGVTPYCIYGNKPGEKDKQQAQGLVYNGYASYFDWLYNGYIDDERVYRDLILNDGTVQADASYGWVYISYVQIVMEKGTKMTVHMINNRNVSDTLNNKDNDGDGGSGKQPQVNMTNGVGYTAEPAAQGPFIKGSTYKSIDLLSSAGRGEEKMGRGVWFTSNSSDSNKDIYSDGKLSSKLVTATKGTTKIFVMGIARGTSYDLGLGLYESSGAYKFGWVVLWNKSQSTKYWIPTGDSYLPDSQTDYTRETEMTFDGNNSDDSSNWRFTSTTTFANSTACQNELLTVLSTGPVFSNGDANGNSVPTMQTLSSKTIVAPKVATSFWDGENGRVARSNTNKEDVNGTDTKTRIYLALGDKQYFTKVTELFETAVTVKKSQKPYLYYDIEYAAGASHLGLLIKYNGTTDLIYVNAAANTVTTASSGVTSNSSSLKKSASIDLTSIFTTLGVSEFNIIGLWQQTWYGEGHGWQTYEHLIRHLEIRYSEDEWRDVIEMDGTKMVDNIDIIGDSLNYTLHDGSKTLTTNYGPKGWAVTGIPTRDVLKKPVYRPQLGHLKFEVPNNATSDGDRITFTARGSHSVKEYKYLYLSVAMVDSATGIAVEDKSGQGFSIRLNSYYNLKTGHFITKTGLTDSISFSDNYHKPEYQHTSLNVALDLETLGKFTSWNQIVFYFYNTTGAATDFHINYCYLSNTPPAQEYVDEISRPFFHAYYLMDASGDRYSTRFPTEYNPTGQVSTVTGETGRVNPMIVERTKRFYEGKLYNGYEMTNKTNDTTKLKKVWFYDYSSPPSGYKNISVYYKRAGYGEEGDMSWQYGRWGSSSSRLDYDKSAGAVTGDMLSLYATANQVLLRSGLEPVKYRTVFDTQGGQMVYGDNSFGIDVGLGGLYENENNIYNTEAVILSYYDWPTTDDLRVDPVKYGYDFKGWYPVKQDDKNASSAKRLLLYDRRESDGIHYFYAWWQKKPSSEKLPNSNETWGTVKNTVTFLDASDKEWFSRDAMQSNGFTVKIPNVTSIMNGNAAKVLAGWQAVPKGQSRPALTADTFLYTSGIVVTVTQDYTFYPITLEQWNSTTGNAQLVNAPHTITVTGAKLYAKSAQTGNWFEITKTSLPGVTVTTSGSGATATRTYKNIPHLALIKLTAITEKANYCWWASFGNGQAFSVINTGDGENDARLYKETVASYNKEFTFSAYTDVTFSYESYSTVGSWGEGHQQKDNNGALIWTAPEVHVYNEGENRQMLFTSQYELPSNATVVEAGTLYTQSRQYDNIISPSELAGLTETNARNAAIAAAFGKAMKFTDSTAAKVASNHTLPASGAVRYLKASTVNSSNQYYMMVTLSKYKENTYYARGYVIYKIGSTTYITYSDIIAVGTLTAES